MAKNYAPVPTVNFIKGSRYFKTGTLPPVVHLEDPACRVMIDFKHSAAITIHQDAPISEARLEMKACNVHMLLVTNDADEIVGLISSEDLLGEKPVKATQEKYVHRAQIKVSMIMTLPEEIVAIEYAQLETAKVGHIVQALKHAKQHYALVVEYSSQGQQQIRGMFSLLAVSRQLDLNLSHEDPLAESLWELNQRID